MLRYRPAGVLVGLGSSALENAALWRYTAAESPKKVFLKCCFRAVLRLFQGGAGFYNSLILATLKDLEVKVC